MRKGNIFKWLTTLFIVTSIVLSTSGLAFAAEKSRAVGTEITVGADEIKKVDVRGDDHIFATTGEPKVYQREGFVWAYRVAEANSSWTYKVTWNGDTSVAAMSVVLNRLHDNLAISVSVDNADWQLIGKHSLVRLGADLSEAENPITVNDGAFKRYYFELGKYFSGGKTLFIKFHAINPASVGASVAGELKFHSSWKKQRGEINLTENTVNVDPTDNASLYDDNDSAVAKNDLGMHRFADATSYFVFKLIMDADKATELYMKLFIMGDNGGISMSPDDKNYTLVRNASDSTEKHGAEVVLADGYTYYYKLDDYVGTETINEMDKKVIYIKFHSIDITDGAGADVYTLQFLNGSVKPQPENPGVIFKQKSLSAEVSVLDDTIIFDSKNSSAATYLGQWGRVASGSDAYFIYKVELPKNATTFSVSVNAINSLVFTASTDNSTYKSFKAFNMGADGNGAAVTYNLTELLASGKTIYLRFNGSVGQDSSLISLYAMYNDSGILYEGDSYDGKSEFFAFSTGDEKEDDYWSNKTNLNVAFNGNYREFNYTTSGIYKFNYKDATKGIKLFGEIGGTYVISISSDGENWTDILASEQQYTTDYKWYTVIDSFDVDITKYVKTDANTAKEIYVKIYDPISDNPYGAKLRGMGVELMSGNLVTKEEPNQEGCSGAGSISLAIPVVILAFAVVMVLKRKKYNH